MTNYYKILGLPVSATPAEIKAAFRALAKLYHPDKNPGGHEDFKKILLAYEVLSDPGKKYAYDMRLKYQESSTHTSVKNSSKKNWTFEEKEMRRRQYYNEHIKKYEKTSPRKEQRTEIKKNYNEYKYILFATPLAVLLFLLVVKFANTSTSNNDQTAEESTIKSAKPDLGDSPYASYFGGHVYDTLSQLSVIVKNLTGKDLIFQLFASGKFVRGCFIKTGYSAEIGQLPQGTNEARYVIGEEWDYGMELKDENIVGGFRKLPEFYQTKLENINQLTGITITEPPSGFQKSNSKEFFRK